MIKIGNRFIHIENTEPREGKPAYFVVNSKSGKKLGTVEWYRYWGRYVLTPLADTVWDVGCLESIIKFINNITTLKGGRAT
jgi:hypothetical protein